MKHLIFPLFLSIICSSGNSQITKGNWLVGGTGSFSSRNSTLSAESITYDSRYVDLTLSPNVGHFIIDKFAVGIKSSFNWTKSRTFPPGGGSTDIKRFSAGPLARYYFLGVEKQFNILTEGSLQLGTYSAGADKGSITIYSFMAGPVVYFNTSVGLEFLLGYSSNIEDVKGSYKDIRDGFQIGIGFQVHLEK